MAFCSLDGCDDHSSKNVLKQLCTFSKKNQKISMYFYSWQRNGAVVIASAPGTHDRRFKSLPPFTIISMCRLKCWLVISWNAKRVNSELFSPFEKSINLNKAHNANRQKLKNAMRARLMGKTRCFCHLHT
jgi:hypothetical protein